jgi:hypothetical protein
MQILPKDDRLVFISEDPTVDEKDKVQSFNWVDIKTIHFIYPKNNILLTIKNLFISVTAFLFASADTTALFNKDVSIIIKLKNGETVDKEFTFVSIKQGQLFEKELLNHLKSADT